MTIIAIRCNMPSFNTVAFQPGLNVVLADRTKESTRQDSRNGLGKTTLIEIIHFCLGSRTQRKRGLLVTPLKGWRFTLDININGRTLAITRSTDNPSRVYVDGDVGDLSIPSGGRNDVLTLGINDWNAMLGELLFGLTNQDSERKYRPTFRSLFSYLVRRGREAFTSPFSHHRTQQEWDKQINNAFLLGLMWEHAGQLQEVKDKEKLLSGLRRAAREGLLEGMVGTRGTSKQRGHAWNQRSGSGGKHCRAFVCIPDIVRSKRRQMT